MIFQTGLQRIAAYFAINLNPEVHDAQFSYSLERTRIFAKFINCGAVQRIDEFSLLFKRMFGQLPDLGLLILRRPTRREMVRPLVIA